MIRSCLVEDCSQVLDVWRDAGAETTITDSAEAVTRLIQAHPGSLLVAETDGRLVGTVIAGWDGWRGCVYRLAVLPDYRRRGIARALVVAGLTRLRSVGAARAMAFVVMDEQDAMAFWDSLHDLGITRDEGKMRYVVTL